MLAGITALVRPQSHLPRPGPVSASAFDPSVAIQGEPSARHGPPRRAVRGSWRWVARSLPVIVVLTAAILLAPAIDWVRVIALLREAGPKAVLLLIPYAVMLVLDAAAWRCLLPGEAPVTLLTCVRVRAASEAMGVALPLGGLGGDALAVWRLRGVRGLGSVPVIASLAARRVVLARAHGLAVCLASLILLSGPASLRPLAWLAAGAGLAATGVSVLGVRILRDGSALHWIKRAARRAPGLRLRRHLMRWTEALGGGAAEASLAHATRVQKLTKPTLLYLALFLVEAIETWSILALVGGGLHVLQVFSFDAPLSLLRAVVPLIPAGLGVQDAGYAAVLVAWGLPGASALAVALVLLKRGKELFYLVVGYLLAQSFWKSIEKQSESGESWIMPAGTVPGVHVVPILRPASD